jgi:WhiB family redox-sensing transcriptional regulator
VSWRDAALCAQTDPDLWYPTAGGDSGAAAKAICARCPVLDACRPWTLADDRQRPELEIQGVQGGMGRSERVAAVRGVAV